MNDRSVCVVGAGRWGKNHIKTLHQLGALGGIVDSNTDILGLFKQQYPGAKYFSTLKEAAQHDFDGFVVATPAETHYEIAKVLVENNKHVLVEKPITLKSENAVKLHELAKKYKINLMVGHVLLFHPAFQKIKQLLTNGKLGDLQYMYSNRLNLGTIRTEENVFWSFAPHDISLFQYFTESYPVKITSRGLDALQDGIHDTTITVLEYPDNVMGHIFVSWLHPFKEHRFVIVGSKGMIRFEDSLDEKPLVFYDKNVKWENGKPVPQSGATYLIEYEPQMPLTAELKYFIDHLDGTPIEIAGGNSAGDVIRIMESATEDLNKNG